MTNEVILSRLPGEGYSQFGKEVFVTQLPQSLLEALFRVDEEVQRKLDPRKRLEIREFIIKSVGKHDFYFSPFVFSARKAIKKTDDGWMLEPGAKLCILDGQHRMSALSSAVSHLKAKKEVLEESGKFAEADEVRTQIEQLQSMPISMQIYLDLDQKQERQLFTDINTERREAHAGLIMQYDQRDEYAELTRNIARKLENTFEIEWRLSRMTNENSAMTSLVTMRKCLLALFEGILSVKTGDPCYKNCNPNDVEQIGVAFFKQWPKIFPSQMANRNRFVCGLTGIQVALAYTVYLNTKKHSITHLEAIERLSLLKNECTWQHDDVLFKNLYDPAKCRIKNHSNTKNIQNLAFEFLRKIDISRGGDLC